MSRPQWRAHNAEGRRSQRQHIERLRHCSESELDGVLAAASKEFRGCVLPMVRVLCHDWGWCLSDACKRVVSAGFYDQDYTFFNNTSLQSAKTQLTTACFDLALKYWSRFEEATKSWFSLRLVSNWRSPLGAELSGDWLQQLRPIWNHVGPTLAQRIPGQRVSGLNWPQKDIEALLNTHVDVDGDTVSLVRELLQKNMLSAGLLQQRGLVGGLLQVDPHLAVEKLLAGEIVLEKPQASLALSFIRALAAGNQEFTKQNVKHLRHFIQNNLVAGLCEATNAMFQAIDDLISLVPRLQSEDRQPIIRAISGVYVGPEKTSQMACIPHPERGPNNQRRALSVHSFRVFLERVLGVLSLEELTVAVRPCSPFPSTGLCDKLHQWSLDKLSEKQSVHWLLKFLQEWLAPLCGKEQVLSFWLKAVDTVGSWSFLLGALPSAATACGRDGRMYDHIMQLLALEPRMPPKSRDEVLRLLSDYWPQRLAEQLGIAQFLQLRGRTSKQSSVTILVDRETHKLSEGASQINDHLQPEQELRRVLDSHPIMHKTKTKEEFALAVDWINNLGTALFCDEVVAEKMSQILCEKWSDRVALLSLCETFVLKLLTCLEETKDSAALVKFVAKCPNLGNKQEFLTKQLGRYAAKSPGKADLAVLHPLFAAQCTHPTKMVDMLHALGCSQVTGETSSLLYDLVDKCATPFEKMSQLKSFKFSTPPEAAVLDECVDCVSWADAEAISETHTESTPQPSDDELLRQKLCKPDLPQYLLHRQFGPRGEAIVHEFFSSALPSQMVEIFERSPLQNLCRAALGTWNLQSCRAEEVDCLLGVVRWYPEVYSRCAPLVWAEGNEAQVKTLLALTWEVAGERLRMPLDLGAVPQKWWHCLHWPSTTSADLLRAMEASVPVPLREVAFASRDWETQIALLDATGEDLDLLVEFAPQVLGPLEPYLERIFELMPLREKELIALGDGIEQEEKLASGWNQMIHRLLTGIRTRIKEGNPLHTDEQLLLFKGCAERPCDNTNSTLLADFMETKMIDPLHIAALVTHVLNIKAFTHTVRDSALRAMMRLPKEDRDALHRRLLERVGPKGLPLQTLFSLVVTQLDDSVTPLVREQLTKLSLENWNELLVLIKDANPAGGSDPHTFPRSLCPEFNERFLLRYLVDEVAKREPRYFRLFVACTKPAAIPQYLLGVLVAQRHALDTLFLGALKAFTLSEFSEILEFLRPQEWSSRLDWVLTRVLAAPEVCDRLRVVLDVLAHSAFSDHFIGLLQEILVSVHARVLLPVEEVRRLLFERLPSAEVSPAARKLRVIFFKESWTAGARYSAAELTEGLKVTTEKPLTNNEVSQLGVDLPAWKLLVALTPALALPSFGFKILEQEAAFAKTLSSQQLKLIRELSAADDKHWATCRRVIAEVAPSSALTLALDLFRHSREARDLDLVATAYQAVDSFTRKQTWLPVELAQLWTKFGHQIQGKVIDPVVPPQNSISLEVSKVLQLSRSPSAASWEVVGEGVEAKELSGLFE